MVCRISCSDRTRLVCWYASALCAVAPISVSVSGGAGNTSLSEYVGMSRLSVSVGMSRLSVSVSCNIEKAPPFLGVDMSTYISVHNVYTRGQLFIPKVLSSRPDTHKGCQACVSGKCSITISTGNCSSSGSQITSTWDPGGRQMAGSLGPKRAMVGRPSIAAR
jgi:hypothetical protein